MSDAADSSRLTALAHKGFELVLKGHNARAVEKFRLAAEEAEKALSPDCLVSCALRFQQLQALICHATASAARPADADDALREVFLRLQPSMMAVLDRRKAAGTLLPGSCRPAEEAYEMDASRHNMELQGATRALAVKRSALLAPFVGIDTYFRAATCAAHMLVQREAIKRAFVLSDEQKHAAYLFVVSAVDLMTLPRDLDSWLCGEPGIVRELRTLIPMVSDMDEPETKKLCAAWQRLLRSGVLQARGIDKGIDQTNERLWRVRAAAAAEVAAGRLHQCALAGCGSKEVHVSQFKRCGACQQAFYCSREHQLADWPAHKAACKAARKTAAGAK